MPQILYVEDDFKAAQATIAFLQSRGHRCFWELDVFRGMKTLLAQPLDLIILDLQLPEVGGLSFLKAIRVLGIEIPVIILSAYIDATTTREALELGPVGVFSKPASLQSIIRKAEEFAELSANRAKGSLFDQVVFNSQQEMGKSASQHKQIVQNIPLADKKESKEPAFEPGSEGNEPQALSPNEIFPGDVLAEDISAPSEQLMLAEGTTLDAKQISHLRRLRQGDYPDKIKVYSNLNKYSLQKTPSHRKKMNKADHLLTILVVDDDPNAQEILKIFLEAEGHMVLIASDGMEALEIINTHMLDVIITDAMMPIMDGFELCRRIKENPGTSLLPVVLVTALDRKDDLIRGIEAGCDDFFTKPFERVELQARIRSLGRLKRLNEDLEHAEEVLKTLAFSVEARDGTTGDHCRRLVETGTAFANYLELNHQDVEVIAKAGILHDIGKIAVPDAVLLKPGPLDDKEWEIMKVHPVEGENLLKPLFSVQRVLPIVRHHHERWDGKGYPDGLKGEEIPYLARVFQLVDIFEALTSPRPYKQALTNTEALEILRAEAQDGMRDPQLIEKFILFQGIL